MFALIDCNNFFVSCERVFRPDLANTPVAVLSSNDGCVVARSSEVKALGVPMGAPLFKYKKVFTDNNITTFSGNFALYGNLSRRITDILTSVTPHIEVYSVDESFLEISTLNIANHREWANQIRTKILKEVGIPVSIGIAPTKTLAKLASEVAKKDLIHQGIFSFTDISEASSRHILQAVPVSDIWGIGRRLTPKLKAEGVHSALQLKELSPRRAQQLLSIKGRQTVAELNGTLCLPLERVGRQQKTIMRGRTFGEDTSQKDVVISAIATMASRASYALRDDRQATLCVSMLVETNRHHPGYKRWYRESHLHTPTTDTGLISSTLTNLLESVYNPVHKYHRVNVYLSNLLPNTYLQIDALNPVNDAYDASISRMQAIDAVNKRFGRNHVRYASEKLSSAWQPRKKRSSPNYIGNWNELPVARIVQ